MRGSILTLVAALWLVGAPAGAFDAQGADIIGLRLGMPEKEAVAILGRQGFPATRVRDRLVAGTRDGTLTIDIAGDRIHEIRYTFKAHGAGESDKIPASVFDRFGPPNQTNPMAWCQIDGRDGKCLPAAASLIFIPETLTLLLRSGSR